MNTGSNFAPQFNDFDEDADGGELCFICYSTHCHCDKEVNARFLARKTTREEYRQASHEDRSAPSATWRPSLLMSHFSDIEDFLSLKSLPEDLQYQAVSQQYRDYITERIADYGGAMREMELERQASSYHLGWD